MENKINIAELLKDCPQGMELYSPLCGKCVFDSLNLGTIICKKQNTQEITFTCEGYYMLPVFDNCECMIFPSKDQRDWSKFQRPFKDGDVVFTTLGNIAIIRKPIGGELFCVYGIMVGNGFYKDETTKVVVARLATEEEKQKLFNAIKENGYKWNAETKTLEKLTIPKFKVGDVIINIYRKYLNCDSKGGKISKIIDDKYIFYTGSYTHIQCQDNYELVSNKLVEPKFKVGDKIVKKNSGYVPILITNVGDEFYYSNTESSVGVLPISEQDDWELVTNKFDITTLKPFDKVLVRQNNSGIWGIDLFGFYNEGYYHTTGNCIYVQCIPYEDNEYLRGTTNDCDDFYKTWR